MSEPTDKPRPERVPSGIPGLDLVLRGGFLRGGIYIIQGPPGAGKTILANQICYHHAAAGHRALYVTLLAENHARMMLHLGALSFYDPARVPSTISYISGFRVMEEEGLIGLLALLGREVRGRGATLLVLDGLISVEERAASRPEFKKFIHLLQTQAALSDCTMFLLTSGTDQVVSPEHTMVDGLIDLNDRLYGSRAERDIYVRKFRGSGFLRGRHAFTITGDGITVYPRIEALLAEPSVPSSPSPGEVARMRTGVVELDKMLGGGLPAFSTTMILGPTGSGKTTLGTHFLAESTAAEPGLFFGFYETPDRIYARARDRQPALASLIDSGDVEVVWHPPTEHLLDDLGGRLLEAIRRRKVRRVFIDGLGGFQMAATEPARMEHFVAALANELRRCGATTLYTVESPDILGPSIAPPVKDVSSKAENLILTRYVEFRSELHRIISVLKMRDGAFDPKLRRFVIRQQGIVVEDSFSGAEAVLSGYARDLRGGERAPSASPGSREAP
jgi:circadian clock protein KaiC